MLTMQYSLKSPKFRICFDQILDISGKRAFEGLSMDVKEDIVIPDGTFDDDRPNLKERDDDSDHENLSFVFYRMVSKLVLWNFLV